MHPHTLTARLRRGLLMLATVAATATGVHRREGQILRRVFPHSLALVVLMVIGVSLVLVFRALERRLLRWQRHHAERMP